ncbi:37S ribosomal protein S9, mitochondrial [Ophidiomyces ophidiicola]|nr:37S ribosomal protein S9, mitochondrial [Ophidiomyces ophidiicola]KAI1942581.1 37S ribosomal protein S9, mitochondrial [Ophidiomyces ophidiicola]KAI1964767.1 37S ribosomal protein S9, mitochondrial [Ophidiomyces ophidiicola]
MSWHRPGCTLRALKSSQCLHQIERTLTRVRIKQNIPHSPCSTSLNTFQQRHLSIFPPRFSENSAPPIDFKNENAIPARIVPESPAYFSGIPKYINNLLLLERICAKYAHLPLVNPDEAPRSLFLSPKELRANLKEDVSESNHTALVNVLKRLNKINPKLMPEEVKSAMKTFAKPAPPSHVKAALPTVDERGRARGVGGRKTSTATAWLVEGDGEIIVNGKSIVHVFPRIHDRESALWSLRITNRIGKYNVFAIVRGGGVTGQAEAMTVAVSRALLTHEPELSYILKPAGTSRIDWRQVERKKPGRVKARKRPAWVKR